MKGYDEVVLREAVAQSHSYKEVLERLSKRAAGGNYKHMQYYIRLWEIDVSHFLTAAERIQLLHEAGQLGKSIPLEDRLTVKSTYGRAHLKQRLYKTGLKTRSCELCGQGEEWNGRHMSLILDHINGVHDDNRLENLRIVCPNCNATLDTHAGRNVPRVVHPPKKEVVRGGTWAPARPSQERILWPDATLLASMVWKEPVSTVAKNLGVSGGAIQKRCKLLRIPTPPRGYWQTVFLYPRPE